MTRGDQIVARLPWADGWGVFEQSLLVHAWKLRYDADECCTEHPREQRPLVSDPVHCDDEAVWCCGVCLITNRGNSWPQYVCVGGWEEVSGGLLDYPDNIHDDRNAREGLPDEGAVEFVIDLLPERQLVVLPTDADVAYRGTLQAVKQNVRHDSMHDARHCPPFSWAVDQHPEHKTCQCDHTDVQRPEAVRVQPLRHRVDADHCREVVRATSHLGASFALHGCLGVYVFCCDVRGEKVWFNHNYAVQLPLNGVTGEVCSSCLERRAPHIQRGWCASTQCCIDTPKAAQHGLWNTSPS